MNISKTQNNSSVLTLRTDLWWLAPLSSSLAILAFVIYATWAAFQKGHFEYQNYHSPFSWPIHPAWWPFSPAFLTIWAPLGFRGTCYYVRRVYYRTFFWDPPACAVGERRKNYSGEKEVPFIFQNLHRFFLYTTLIELAVLWLDAIHGFIFSGRFGFGIGSLVLLINSTLLSLYTFSCHAFRHLVGGNLDCFSQCPKRSFLWKKVSILNERHGLYMWISLGWVGFSDLYVRLLSMGIWKDWRFF
ncbi:MAG: succinate dehydrogenase [Chlamydiae bacterium]|nr:succinate dehydrogenase [Chlamydiota bacterium]MBI3277186.1 succinate dehydrogenase [Chlamydiota bacterium]